MEGLDVVVHTEFWAGKRVFLTGHTGFKGSWLALWLQQMGTVIRGLALEPATQPSLYVTARVGEGLESIIADVADLSSVQEAVRDFQPDVVIHMAAQPLVRASYVDPVLTYRTNVMGTVNILEALRAVDSVRCILNVTTDKCYENKEWLWPYRETEQLGGHDPYSSSKACSELVTSAYYRSFFAQRGVTLASGRAGNVIGGGDWSADRLVPDLLRAFDRSQVPRIRNPGAIRPWQHVLAPLSGYLSLVESMWQDGDAFSGSWNFGPPAADARPVSWVADRLSREWGDGAVWAYDEGVHPHEAGLLMLDSSRANHLLGWHPGWSLKSSLHSIVRWHKAWKSGDDMRRYCLHEIDNYCAGSAMNAQVHPDGSDHG